MAIMKHRNYMCSFSVIVLNWSTMHFVHVFNEPDKLYNMFMMENSQGL